METTTKGMLACIYKNPLGECTNGGVSSKHKRAVVTGFGMPEIFEVGDDSCLLELVQRRDGTYYAKPKGETRWTMFGGNFVWSSDSRFRRICEAPIAIHDRIED